MLGTKKPLVFRKGPPGPSGHSTISLHSIVFRLSFTIDTLPPQSARMHAAVLEAEPAYRSFRQADLGGDTTMSNLVRSVLAAASLILSPPCFAQETYSNPTLGFSIRKPSSWHYLTAEQHRENLKRSDFTDPKFKELMTRYARTPFLAITKHKEPHDDLNPSLRVNAREVGNLKGMAPEKVVELTASTFSRMFKDYAVAEGPVATKLSGHPAGYMRVNYTYEAGGVSWGTTSELWIVPRGDLVFIIGAGTRQDEKSGTRKEVRSIIDTIKID
jgi:hypothetical protein